MNEWDSPAAVVWMVWSQRHCLGLVGWGYCFQTKHPHPKCTISFDTAIMRDWDSPAAVVWM
eukprot:scaffold94590_cov76-Cyclotella_meneghiniana.AAC.1